MANIFRTIEFLCLSLWLGSDVFLSFVVAPGTLLVVLMIMLTVVSQHAVSPRMAALRVQMGSIEATAAENPLLTEFHKLHRRSVLLESGVLLAGIAAMFWLVREGG